MNKTFQYAIRTVEEQDREWVLGLIGAHWGGSFVVVHEEVYYPHQLPGFIAEGLEDEVLGLVTYRICGNGCEIITLNSLIENQGVGSKLVQAVVDEAKQANCDHLHLTTTNDNQRAIDFYSKIGFEIKEIRRGAVEKARKIKPSIPEFSPAGIPLRDELVFEKSLSGRDEE